MRAVARPPGGGGTHHAHGGLSALQRKVGHLREFILPQAAARETHQVSTPVTWEPAEKTTTFSWFRVFKFSAGSPEDEDRQCERVRVYQCRCVYVCVCARQVYVCVCVRQVCVCV